jgi:hypothetical protein
MMGDEATRLRRLIEGDKSQVAHDASTANSAMNDGALRLRYETAVVGLRVQVVAMQDAGHPPEAIARAVHAERRRLAATFKELTPEPLRSQIYKRTLAVYGDPIGPTIETLRDRGKSWGDIIGSAVRPGPLPSPDDIIESTATEGELYAPLLHSE